MKKLPAWLKLLIVCIFCLMLVWAIVVLTGSVTN